MTAQLAESTATEDAPAERSLAELEAVIDAGLQTFVQVGQALAEIRERRLYRDEYDSFEVYCRTRFNFNHQRASQLIKAAEVSRILDSPPARASHAEALARVSDPAVRQEVHDEVRAAKGSRATQADYDEAIAKRQTPRHAPDPEVGDDYVEDFNQDPGDDFPADADPDDSPLTDRGRAEADDDADPVSPAVGVEGEDGASDAPDPAPTVTLPPSQEDDRDLPDDKPAGGKGKAKGGHSSASIFSGNRTLDAGDLARTLLDLPGWLEALAENATASQKQALRQALGGTAQPAPRPPATVTLTEVKALIRTHLTAAEIRLLESELPMLRKEIGARERQLAASGAR